MRPRRNLLLAGFGLMILNRVAGLVLPASTKFFIDDVIAKHRSELLLPLLLAVVGATAIQGVTSFSLTQLLSKAAQRLIADMRRRVQAHVGRLPLRYYDDNKTGTLVSRIMTDVEGIRNLIGTGLVDFVGGLMTAALSLFMLLRISTLMTGLALGFIVIFALVVQKAFTSIRPIFRERGKITAEVTGRLTESLGGVRVIKGYHAEAREEAVFSGGVDRLLNNILKSLTATSLMGLSANMLLGVVGAVVMFVGARQIAAQQITLGDFVTFTMFLAFLIAPVAQIVSIGTQLTEALAGLERTREVLHEAREQDDPGRSRELGVIDGRVRFEEVGFAYETGKTVLEDVSFTSEPGTVTALVGPSGSGKSTIIGLVASFYKPVSGRVSVDDVDLSTVRLDSYRTQLGVVLQDTFLFDGTIRENVQFARPQASEAEVLEACRIARVDEFAERFDDKLDTIVGERGVKLSGGQRQRVSIARAILADPRILILDEATSSLDSESEALIQEGPAVPDEGPDDVCDRPPPLHHPPRRADPGGGRRTNHRTRQPRGAVRRRGPLLRSLYAPARPGSEPVPGARRGRRHRRGGVDRSAEGEAARRERAFLLARVYPPFIRESLCWMQEMRSFCPALLSAAAVMVGMVALPGALPAQTPLTLDAAVDLARRTHPLLAASAGRVTAAQSAVAQASLRPNPRLFVQTENLRNWSSIGSDNSQQTDTFAYLSQPIETAGKRGLRTASADAARRRLEIERDLTERQVILQVKRAYWTAAGAARIHGAILENLDLFHQIIDYHEKRVREGALPEADLLKVQLEGERLRLAANTASLDAERARIDLQRAMGQSEFPAVQLSTSLDANSPAPRGWTSRRRSLSVPRCSWLDSSARKPPPTWRCSARWRIPTWTCWPDTSAPWAWPRSWAVCSGRCRCTTATRATSEWRKRRYASPIPTWQRQAHWYARN